MPRKPKDHYIKVGNINTRYWVLGDQGVPVILIHGLGASAEIWQKNVEALAEQYRVYVPDLVGFGRSDKPSVDYSPSYFTGFINDFMNALNIKRTCLVGNSLGGGIALQYALQFPHKVEKLVLVDSAGLGKEVTFPLRLMSLPVIGELMTRPSRKGVYLYFKPAVGDPVLLTEDFIDLYYELHSLPGAQKSMLRVLRSISNIRGGRTKILRTVMARLHTMTVPTLIVWGKQDKVLPVRHAYVANEKILNSKVHILDPCGHMPQFERPEEFNRIVLEFLSGG